MRWRGLIWITAFSAAGLAMLIGLGVWQLQRLAWKESLITRIEARTKADPVSIDEALEMWRRTGEAEYARVRLNGRFRNDQELYLYTVGKGGPGWNVITPLALDSGMNVLVTRGFVRPDRLDPSSRSEGLIEGVASVTGLIRAPDATAPFTPDNDPVNNRWYWRDLEGMAKERGYAMDTVAPFYVEADATPNPGGWPKGGVTRLDLPNRHLEYAITWFGIGCTLIGVYAVFVTRRVRELRDVEQPNA